MSVPSSFSSGSIFFLKTSLANSDIHVMLHYMARGKSGRIVLEIDPSQKDGLYSALTRDGLTLKDWFLRQAAQYLRGQNEMPPFSEPVVSEKPTHTRSTLSRPLFRRQGQEADARRPIPNELHPIRV